MSVPAGSIVTVMLSEARARGIAMPMAPAVAEKLAKVAASMAKQTADLNVRFAPMLADLKRHDTPENRAAEAGLMEEYAAGTLWRRLISRDTDYSESVEAWKTSESARARLAATVRAAVANIVPERTAAQARNLRQHRAASQDHLGMAGTDPDDTPPPRRIADVHTLVAAPHGPTVALAAAA
jgi:hypothetical protein